MTSLTVLFPHDSELQSGKSAREISADILQPAANERFHVDLDGIDSDDMVRAASEQAIASSAVVQTEVSSPPISLKKAPATKGKSKKEPASNSMSSIASPPITVSVATQQEYNEAIDEQMNGILTALKAERTHSAPFLRRPTGRGAAEINSIITHPMDMATLGKNVSAGQYAGDLQAFKSDVMLMYSNSRKINMQQQDGELLQHAQYMETRTAELFDQLPVIKLASASNPPTQSIQPIVADGQVNSEVRALHDAAAAERHARMSTS